VAKVPALLPENLDGALLLLKDGHLDIHELLWSYLRHARKRGAALRCGEAVRNLIVEKGVCKGVVTDSGRYESKWVVNAAGAWAERVRSLAGPSPVGLAPFRRTIISFAAPPSMEVGMWPLTADLTHELYFAPESGGMFASPMDQDPQEPCDARPDEYTVALTVERLKQFAPVLTPRSLIRKWAGLRTFSSDHAMVIGEDADLKGFFWLAGQGGAGIETSPAVGRMAAELILKGKTELTEGFRLSPKRFLHP
jgi:D-arginine dehydrogenase